MASQARLGRPTGPRPGFSRDDVVDAALEIGIAEFTLTAVAKQLGVAVSGLYRTITSREDLLAACLERIAAQIEVPRPGKRWPDTVRAHAEAVWEMLERYPGLAGVIMGVPWAHQLFAAPVAQACQILVDGGLDRKIEIIIRGVATGLPPSATDTGGKSASGGDVSGRR